MADIHCLETLKIINIEKDAWKREVYDHPAKLLKSSLEWKLGITGSNLDVAGSRLRDIADDDQGTAHF